MISADKTISTNKLITTDRMAGKEKKSGRNKLTDGKAERVKATATEALPVVRGELALLIVLVINSLGVVLMLYSGFRQFPVCRMHFQKFFPKFHWESGQTFFRQFWS